MTRASILCALLLFALPGAARADDEPESVKKIRAAVPDIMKQLEELRGNKFKRDVEVRYQTDAEFRAWMQKEVDEQYPPEKAARDLDLLSAVGLLKPTFDIRAEMIDAMASQAMAYYDPRQGAFFVLEKPMDPEMAKVYVLHELQHALQDQSFDLKTTLDRFNTPGFDREDEANAFKFLMEGEATYLMLKYALDKMGQGNMLEMQLQMQGTMPRDEYSKLERMQAQMQGDKAALEALDKRAKMPNYLYRGLIDPYNKGAWFVYQLVKSRGRGALNEVFKAGVHSTEQALHFEKCLGEGRDEPTELTLPDLSETIGGGVELRAQNTLGELECQIVFQELCGDEQAEACAGWDGDRLQAYKKPSAEGWASIVWALTFDSEQDAKQFAKALDAKKSKGPPPLAEAKVTVDGVDVLVVGGVPADKLEAVQKAAREGLTKKAFGE